MKNKSYYFFISLVLLILAFAGCRKVESHYYADETTPGTAIFTNTGNNVMTTLFNGHPWRTVERSSGGVGLGSGYTTELQIIKLKTASTLDTLVITWKSDDYNQDNYDISLVLPVAKNFTWNNFSSFQGKRFTIDSTNGFFALTHDYYNFYNQLNLTAGKGSVYFNTAYLDSSSVSGVGFRGRISGLLEASINANGINAVISSGRFDDALTSGEVRSY
ncbi:MAG: hypothetical protein QM726_14390 [Chitinophagaceae bacterium]